MNFTNVIKPTHLCNLDCKYCYNDDVRDPVMQSTTLERTIEQTFAYVREYTPDRIVNFIWHGGEPTIAKIGFFEYAVELEQRYAGDLRYTNSLQTNGTLLNKKWIKFLRNAQFEVSISIDGPQEINDKLRVTRNNKGSYERILKAIQLVQEANLPLGVCVVMSRANARQIKTIYQFLTDNHLPFNIIPLNHSGAARDNYSELGLDREEYSDAWIEMYDLWFHAHERYVLCTDFVVKTRAIAAGRPADCIGLARCADSNIAVDPVGNVYPCATLSGSANTLYGNIMASSLADLLDSPTAKNYRNRKIDPQCAECKWQHVCHGGCPARSYKFFGNPHARDYYCPSLFRIYEHIADTLHGALKNFDIPIPVKGLNGKQQSHY